MKTTAFLRFWYALNLAMRERGLPEILFGEAHGLWSAANEL